MHLYDSTVPSGNAYKVQLLLAHLKIPYQTTSLNILAKPSESHTPEFLKLNPIGKVPVLVLDDGTPLAESDAILFYLAEGTDFLPSDKTLRAQVLQWLFFEQFSHEPYVAKAKFHTYWGDFKRLSEAEVRALRENGQKAIDIMERHLVGRDWFVGREFSIADIALYVYTSYAERAGFKVEARVREWLKRVEDVDGHVRIKEDPTGKCPT